jgi:hypothetical protein
MTNEERYRLIALDLLEMYVDAEETVISEFSGNFYESRMRLEKEIKKQLKKLDAEDMFEEITNDKWIFEVEGSDSE